MTQQKQSSNNRFNLLVVGAGISSAYTLMHYIDILRQLKPAQPARIAVLDMVADFWTGVPYGSRTGYNPLIITALNEFIPQEPERSHFKEWLSAHKNQLFNEESAFGGPLTTLWLGTHKAEIENNDWDHVFLPRFVFGAYMKACMEDTIRKAAFENLAEFTLVQGEALDVQQTEDGLRVDYTDTAGTAHHLIAEKLLLGIGSPPSNGFEAHHAGSPGFITDLYAEGLDHVLSTLKDRLVQKKDETERRLLIVGSNASTLDLIYALNNDPITSKLVTEYVVLSPNGAFPHRIHEKPVVVQFAAQSLVELIKNQIFTAKDILHSVREDVARAEAAGINIADIFPEISKRMIDALDLLSQEEQRKFVSIYAVEIGKLQRRAGYEYLNVVNQLIAEQRFIFVKGRFTGYIPEKDGGPGCLYTTPTGESQIMKGGFVSVVTCAGFQSVSQSKSTFIQSLLRNGICQANESDRGFVVNERFETSENCYLMGPLIAGNLSGNIRVWHAESCSRIINMSKSLADILSKEHVTALR